MSHPPTLTGKHIPTFFHTLVAVAAFALSHVSTPLFSRPCGSTVRCFWDLNSSSTTGRCVSSDQAVTAVWCRSLKGEVWLSQGPVWHAKKEESVSRERWERWVPLG